MTVSISAPHDFSSDGLEGAPQDKRIIALTSTLVVAMGIYDIGPGTETEETFLYAGSISGDTITWGTEFDASVTGTANVGCLARLSDSTFVLMRNNTDLSFPIVGSFSVSGTTISQVADGVSLSGIDIPGDINSIYPQSAPFPPMAIAAIDATHALAVFGLIDVQGFEDYDHYLIAVPVVEVGGGSGWETDGSAVVLSTVFALTVRDSPFTNLRMVRFGSNSFALAYTEEGVAKVVHLDATGGAGTTFNFPDSPGNFDIDALDTTSAIILAFSNPADSDKGYAVYHEITAGSLASGTAVKLFDSATEDRVNVVALSSTSFVAVYRDAVDSIANAVEGTISGSTISVGDETNLNIEGHTTGTYSDIDLLSSSLIVYAQRQVTTGFGTAYVLEVSAVVYTKALGVAVERTFGTIAVTTSWKSSGELVVQYVDLTNMTILAEQSLGSCTESELDSETYIAYPFFGPGGRLYIFGRMNDPQSLGDPAHIINLFSGAWTATETGWGSDICSALFVETDGSIAAIRNVAGGNAKLYRGNESGVSLKTTLTIPGVNWRAIDVDPYTGDVFLGADEGGAPMVIKVSPPFTALHIVDLTYDHDQTDPITSVVLL